jgi:uncharacterized membrane protein
MTRFAALTGRGWPVAALVASLVLNAFLIGMIVADSFGHRHRGSGPRLGGFELRRLAEKLPREAVRQVAAELEAQRPSLEARFERLRAMREEINAAAALPNPDRAAIDDRLAALRTESAALQADVQRATYDAILKLPPEVRAGLAAEPDNG